MIRAIATLALAVALAACGVIGPSQAETETALHEWFISGVRPGQPDLHEARIVDFEGCRPLNGFYQCPIEVETPGGRFPVLVWLEHDGDHWKVQNVVLNRRTH